MNRQGVNVCEKKMETSVLANENCFDVNSIPVFTQRSFKEPTSDSSKPQQDSGGSFLPAGMTDKSMKRTLKETTLRMDEPHTIKIMCHSKSKQVNISTSEFKVQPVIVQSKKDRFIQNNKMVDISSKSLASHQGNMIGNVYQHEQHKGNKPVSCSGVVNSSTKDIHSTAPHMQLLHHNQRENASQSKDAVESSLPEVASRIPCIPLAEEVSLSQESMGQNHVRVLNEEQTSKGTLALAVPQSPTSPINHSFGSNKNVLESSCLFEVENSLTSSMSSNPGPSNLEAVHCHATSLQSSLDHNESASLSKGIIKSPVSEVTSKINETPSNVKHRELHHASTSYNEKKIKGISTVVVHKNYKTRLTNHSLGSKKNVTDGCSLTPTENYTNCTVPDVKLRFDKSVKNCSSDLASSMSARIPVAEKVHQDESSQHREIIPSIESCLPSWMKIFPWVNYIMEEKCFVCKICYWGNANYEISVVYTLKIPSDVLLVAGKLRIHKNSTIHEKISVQLQEVSGILQHLYTCIKNTSFRSLNDITDALSSHANSNFLCSLIPRKKFFFVSYAIRYIAECIELNLLKALSNSPFFSIVAFEEMDYAILRWLNHKGKPEEHIFSNHITCPGEIMSISYYLQQKKVDMSKMISCSHFPTFLTMNLSNDWTKQIPVRGPPLHLCLSWLEQTELLKTFFPCVKTFVKLCKNSHHRFIKFHEVGEVLKVEEPYAHNCIVNENIMRFFFQNFKELKIISKEIYEETGNMEAYHFSTMDIINNRSVQFCLSPLPPLYLILKRINDFSSLCTVLKEFRRKMKCRKRLGITDHRVDEVVFLLDTYLFHVIIFLDTQKYFNTKIFTKKLKNVHVNVIDEILTKTQADYRGGSKQCLRDLDAFFKQMPVNEDCTIMELLECLSSNSDFHQAFPHLLRLHQRISVLPFFCADIEQYKFDILSSQMSLKGKVSDELLFPLTILLLEGRSLEITGAEFYLAHWSKKWKMRID